MYDYVKGYKGEEIMGDMAEHTITEMAEHTTSEIHNGFKELSNLISRHKWKTANGKIIKIKEMEDSHIENTIGFLTRKLSKSFEGEFDILLASWINKFETEKTQRKNFKNIKER